MSQSTSLREDQIEDSTEIEHPRSDTICIIGLGYVGLPLAEAFDSAGFDVIGYDISEEKIDTLESGTDPTGDVGDERIEESSISFTTNPEPIARARYVIITVPTPVDDLKHPDLAYVKAAGETVGEHIRPNSIVVLESTVYPGATREVLAPAIERTSDLTAGEEFFLGYSPERMVPGDDEHGLKNVVKIVSADYESIRAELSGLYGRIVDAGIHEAPSIETAEAAKCVENIQRDLNIAFVNELALALDNLDLDTHDVLEAAGTKWNFHDYQPGLVGGHCIPVDPFFMIYEANRNGFTPQLMEIGREVNDYMPKHVAKLTMRELAEQGKDLEDCTVLVLGLAYKPNVGDIRTSIIDGTIKELRQIGTEVVGCDPHVDRAEAEEMFDIEMLDEPTFDGIDTVILATPHDEFLEIDFDDKADSMTDRLVLFDVDAVLDRDSINASDIEYLRL